MTKRWLICLLIISHLAVADPKPVSDAQKYRTALDATVVYLHSEQNENKLLQQKVTDCDQSRLLCESHSKNFLGLTTTEWTLIGGAVGFGLGAYLTRR